jgi:hypothetical protein
MCDMNEEIYLNKLNNIENSDFSLSEEEKVLLKEEIEKIHEEKKALELKELKLGQLLDYASLKEKGFSNEEISKFYKEDDKYIKDVLATYNSNHERRNYMFGYPANLEDSSYNVRYLKTLESKLFLMHNCGDPYQTGNYGMDS